MHRDIKSQNILIDTGGAVKVTDFGIAKADDSQMTEAGSILGTAQYLAPEQAKGEPVDERTDLYSVGVVVYEMLTGSLPFRGDSAVTVALKHVNEQPPEPVELVPGLPYSLNQIVLKALAKDPDLRYSTAAEFSADLVSARSGGPLLAATYDPSLERTIVQPPAGNEGTTRVLPKAAVGAGLAAGAGAAAGTAAANGRTANGRGNGQGGDGRDGRRRKRSPWPWIALDRLSRDRRRRRRLRVARVLRRDHASACPRSWARPRRPATARTARRPASPSRSTTTTPTSTASASSRASSRRAAPSSPRAARSTSG